MTTGVRATDVAPATPGTLIADNWLDISTAGFAAENAGRPRPHLAKELVQNALDAIGDKKGRVDVRVHYNKAKKCVTVSVEDDGVGIPTGDLHRIRTVFWTSKQDSVLKRGRMGRGFKEMLCLAVDARVDSNRAALVFVREGGEQRIYADTSDRANGTAVVMDMPWPEVAVDELVAYFQTFLTPANIRFNVNGTAVTHRKPKHQVTVSLPTEMFADGTWKRSVRRTVVDLVPARADERGMIFEMGIPVCDLEWDFAYHANVQQRVPMNPKRDATQTGYTKKIHAAAVPVILDELSKDEVMSDVVSAVAPSLDEGVQREIIRKVLGEKIVREVPSLGRRDFNDDAQDLGFRPVNVAQLSGGLREIVKSHVP